VWIAGDSTVANGNTPCPAGWGKHFGSYLNDDVTINNAAVGGRSVRTWLYNVTSEMGVDTECVLQTDGSGQPTLQARWQGMLDGMQAGDTLMIQFGINDGSATCDRHVGIEAFKESYGMMADAAKARGAQPIFITPVSAIACNGTTARGTRGGYVDATIEAGVSYDVPVIDLHQLSVDRYHALGFCPVPGGDVSGATTGPVGDFFCDDHTHFSDSGAQDIAALVAGALRDLGVGLGQYLED
jgi:lysophospholipase L1-like esterase